MLYRRLIIKKKWESIDIGLNTLLFGVLSYLLLQLIYSSFNKGELIIWQRLQDNQSVPYFEIFQACMVSIFATGVVVAIVNKQLVNKVANWLRITTKYGEYNLFYTFLSSNDVSEVHVKDPENNLIYTGYVRYYSEDDDVREIVLEDVDLFEYDTAVHMNSLSYVYLNRAKSDILIIEIPKKNNNGKTEKNNPDTQESRQKQKRDKHQTSSSKGTKDTAKTEP